MISVIVATCFVVFIGLGNTSLLYYAAKVSDSVQGKGITGRYKVCVGRQTTEFVWFSISGMMSDRTQSFVPT